MARVPSIRDCCTSKLPPGLMSHNKGQKVLSFCFFANTSSVVLLPKCKSGGMPRVCLEWHTQRVYYQSLPILQVFSFPFFSFSFLFFLSVRTCVILSTCLAFLFGPSSISWEAQVEMCLIGCLCHDQPAVCRLVGRARPLCNRCGPVPKQNLSRLGFYF
jgi:hypothetical protein